MMTRVEVAQVEDALNCVVYLAKHIHPLIRCIALVKSATTLAEAGMKFAELTEQKPDAELVQALAALDGVNEALSRLESKIDQRTATELADIAVPMVPEVPPGVDKGRIGIVCPGTTTPIPLTQFEERFGITIEDLTEIAYLVQSNQWQDD